MTSTISYEDYEAARQMSALLAGEADYSPGFGRGFWIDLLKPACSGSSGAVMHVLDYGPILPHIGSSSFIVDCRPAEARVSNRVESKGSDEFQELVSLSIVEQMRELRAALSLNKSQLAQVLRVTRPTVYDWIQGKEPNIANSKRLHAMLRILARASVSGAAPLNSRFVRQSTGLDAPSIIELLAEQHLDESRVVRAMEQAQTLADAASRRRTTREERLRALGFEDPTNSERRERLAKNVALKDWPRR